MLWQRVASWLLLRSAYKINWLLVGKSLINPVHRRDHEHKLNHKPKRERIV